MFVKQLVRHLQYEYTRGKPTLYYINEALKYYYDKHDTVEVNRNKILLSQFQTNNKYSRISLYNEKDFELAMIMWRKDSQTKIHKHDTDCCFMILEGELFETRYFNRDKLILKDTIVYEESDIGNILENEYHNIFNISSENSLSLHVYDNSENSETNINLMLI